MLYATFGRPHTLLFAWLMWSTLLALEAADRGSRRLWIAAGAALGLSVFVHPTAPLYAGTALIAALVYAYRDLRTLWRETWPGLLAFAVTFGPYYVRTLHVLGDTKASFLPTVGAVLTSRYSPDRKGRRTRPATWKARAMTNTPATIGT